MFRTVSPPSVACSAGTFRTRYQVLAPGSFGIPADAFIRSQNYFRETSCIPLLAPLLLFPQPAALNPASLASFAFQPWSEQKVINAGLVISLVRMLVGGAGTGRSGNQKALLTSGLTRCLAELALASNAPAVLKSQVRTSSTFWPHFQKANSPPISLSTRSPTSFAFPRRTKKPSDRSSLHHSFLHSFLRHMIRRMPPAMSTRLTSALGSMGADSRMRSRPGGIAAHLLRQSSQQ